MNREQQLFDKLKEIPTELSLEEVNTIISILPTLPPPTKVEYLMKFKFLSMFVITTIILSLIITQNEKSINTTDESKLVAIKLNKVVEKNNEVLTDLILTAQKKSPTKKYSESDTQSVPESIKPTTQLIFITKLPVKSLDKIILKSTTPKLPIQFHLPSLKSPSSTPPNTNAKSENYAKENLYSVKMLEIKSNDPIQKLKEMETILQDAGLNIELSHSLHKNNLVFKNILIHFTHVKGLNFKLSGIGFGRLQIKLFLNEHQQIQYFIYRFNEEAFTNPVPLHCKGNKQHHYTENMTGISGTTNVNLGYKRLDAY